MKKCDIGTLTPNTDLVYQTVVSEFATSFGTGKVIHVLSVSGQKANERTVG